METHTITYYELSWQGWALLGGVCLVGFAAIALIVAVIVLATRRR